MELKLCTDNASPDPVYVQMRNQIADAIQKQNLPEGTLLPDIRTLSKQANVSLRTIHRALDMLIQDGVCVRRPKKGTLVAGASNRASRKACCVYAPRGIGGWETPEIPVLVYSGIQACAGSDDMDVLTLSGPNADAYLRLPGVVVLGCIVVCWSEFGEALRFAESHPKLPCVFVNYEMPHFEDTAANIRGVFNDDFAGGYQSANELVRRGRRRIVAITMALPSRNYDERVAGYRAAMRDSGLGDILLASVPGERHAEQRLAAYEATIPFLKQNARPDGIVCVNDQLAEGVVDAINELGLSEQVDLIGYDNLFPEISARGGFSTMKVDYRAMGTKAVQMLQGGKLTSKQLRIAPSLLPRWKTA